MKTSAGVVHCGLGLGMGFFPAYPDGYGTRHRLDQSSTPLQRFRCNKPLESEECCELDGKTVRVNVVCQAFGRAASREDYRTNAQRFGSAMQISSDTRTKTFMKRIVSPLGRDCCSPKSRCSDCTLKSEGNSPATIFRYSAGNTLTRLFDPALKPGHAGHYPGPEQRNATIFIKNGRKCSRVVNTLSMFQGVRPRRVDGYRTT